VIAMSAFAVGLFASVPAYSDQAMDTAVSPLTASGDTDTAFSLLSTSVDPEVILVHKKGYKGGHGGYRSWYGPGLLFYGGLYGYPWYGGYYGAGTGTYQEGNKVCVFSGYGYDCYDSFSGNKLN
ncbi:MAG: hypothetical protein AB1664_12730, partial [Thermodesulfobacteriota bacterium]